MQNTNTPENHEQGADNMRSAEELTTQARNRRRILLKGIGKGSAVLAATVPLQTLAAQRLTTANGLDCHVSGSTSGPTSVMPLRSAVCGGFGPRYWGADVSRWPAMVNSKAPVKNVLRRYQNETASLFELMQSTISSTGKSKKLAGEIFASAGSALGSTFSDEVHWVCAWLNATKLFGGEAGSTYPYNPEQVLVFYNEPDPKKYADALKFFSTHLENLN